MKEFITKLNDLARDSGGRPWHTFTDFCELAYCLVAKTAQHPDFRDKIEERYLECADNYDHNQLKVMSELLGLTMTTLTENPYEDFLGTIYEDQGFSSKKWGGQYWTPTHLATLAAHLTLNNVDRTKELITVADPACGSGRMLLAAGKMLEAEKIDVPQRVWMEAIDIDMVCFQMTYLQLSFAGIPAVVRHQDSISLESWDWAITPSGAHLYQNSQTLRDWLTMQPGPEIAPVTMQPDLFSSKETSG